MKCVKSGDQIKRVSDESAMELVKHGWAYCPKSEYKSLKKYGKAKTNDENVDNNVDPEKVEPKKPRKPRKKKTI